MTKEALRKVYVKKRRELDEMEVTLRSTLISNNFFDFFDIRSIRVMHTFLPIQVNHEPDTWLIIKQIWQEFPDTRIAIPRVLQNSGELEHLYLSRETELKTSSWGIQEPLLGIRADVRDVDAVLVPLLAFDLTGNRVGYGKGFYDRFLNECRRDTKRIGISLFEPVEKIDDIHSDDELLHFCVTPYGVVSF